MKIEYGIRIEHTEDAIDMYTIAFESKYLYFLEDRETMKRIVRHNFNPRPVIAVISDSGVLMGFVALYLNHEKMFNLSASSLIKEFGFFKGMYKILLLWFVFYRKIRKDELYIDHIVVAPDFRSRGVGKILIDEVAELAKEKSYNYIGLDVIEENPKALRLYQSIDFKIIKYQKVPHVLAQIIGTKGVNSMLKDIAIFAE